MNAKQNELLGELTVCPIGAMLGQHEFKQFTSPVGVKGLVKADDNTVVFLAIDAIKPGNGDFRKFIAQLKENWSTIVIVEIFNPFLPDVLKRYGFFDGHIKLGKAKANGMLWVK